MLMKMTYAILLLFFISLNVNAQNNSLKKGVLYGDVFVNANYNYQKDQASFRLNRLHLGYKYKFNDNLYFNGMIESAREDYEPEEGYNNITNLFEFCLGFKLEKVEGKFGLIGTEFNQLQEKLWQHRYIDKVFVDKYGFAPTNDFGGIVILKPIDSFNFDFAVTNGEGHKSGQTDKLLRYALGATFKPSFGLMARLYADMLFYHVQQQTNMIVILGYQNKTFSAGVEYNQQYISENIDNNERMGMSFYASINFFQKFQIFGRMDFIQYDRPEDYLIDWDTPNDGYLLISGIQYQIHKNILFAIDYRAWTSNINKSVSQYAFLDLAVSF